MSRLNSIQKLLEMKAQQKQDSKDLIVGLLKSGEKTIYELCDGIQIRQARRLLKELEEDGIVLKDRKVGKGNQSLYKLTSVTPS